MSVNNYSGNGSTMTFGVGVVPLVDLHQPNDPATFDTTGMADGTHTSGAGLPKNSFTASFLGSKCPKAGAIANVAVNIKGGGAGDIAKSYGKALITQMSVSGRKDGRIEGNFTAVAGADALTAGSYSAGAVGDLGFNGTSVTFGSALIGLQSVNYTSSAAPIDCTGAGDTDTLSAPGIKEESVTVTCLGGLQGLDVKHTAALAIAWNDGGSNGSFDLAILVSTHPGAAIDGQTTTEFTFKPFRATS